MHVDALEEADRPWLRERVREHWGLPVVSSSGAHDPAVLPGFVAHDGDEPVGALAYRIGPGELEVVLLLSLRRRAGVGSALLAAARRLADDARLRLWLLTTDDNPGAIAFYERCGLRRVRVHRGFIEVTRASKPEIAPDAFRDAFEYSY